MASSMAISPNLGVIGGNQIAITPDERIQITNKKGKVKVLSQDQFKKQIIKNVDKIQSGEDFEFKKSNTGAKIAIGTGLTLLATYIGLGIAVAKGKLTKATKGAKDLTFWNKVQNFFYDIGDSARSLWTKTEKTIITENTNETSNSESASNVGSLVSKPKPLFNNSDAEIKQILGININNTNINDLTEFKNQFDLIKKLVNKKASISKIQAETKKLEMIEAKYNSKNDSSVISKVQQEYINVKNMIYNSEDISKIQSAIQNLEASSKIN